MTAPRGEPTSSLFTLVDVGARGGVDPRWRAFADVLRVVAIDADEHANPLPPADWGIARYDCIRAAVGPSAGSLNLYITRSPGCSSTLRPNNSLLDQFPESERFDVVELATVRSLPLDQVVSDGRIDHVDFIKLDTQGSELSILKGATGALASAVGVEVEVEFVPMYEGPPLFGDVDAFMREKGFVLFDLNRGYWRHQARPAAGRGRLIFADALYFRPPEHFAAESTGAGPRLVKAVLAAAAYGYADYARTLLAWGTGHQMLGNTEAGLAEGWLARANHQSPGLLRLMWRLRGMGRLSHAVARLADVMRPDHWAYVDQRLGNTRKQ